MEGRATLVSMADQRSPSPPPPNGSPPDRRTLVKYLVAAGLGSRRHCAALVLSGYVTVNGEPGESLMMPVTHNDLIEVDGRPVVARRTGHVYLLANKPDGYLSSVGDDRGRPTVIDLVPRSLRMSGLVPAGRLDLHSTGLILLTDDGELVNRVTHPRYEIDKEYHVTLDGVLTPSGSSKLRTGVTIETGEARAMAIRRLHEESGFRYSITLNEGRKREVRLMFRYVGRQVLVLQRVRIGNLLLAGLKDGEVREMTSQELAGLRRLVGMRAPGTGSGPQSPPQEASPKPLPRVPHRAPQIGASAPARHSQSNKRRPGGPSGPKRADKRPRLG